MEEPLDLVPVPTTPRPPPRPRRLRARPPELTVKQILAWADAHHERTGKWPKAKTGPVTDTLCETWAGIDAALRGGFRGLPGGSALPRLLAAARGVRNHRSLPALTHEQILTWADAHHARTGQWPSRTSGIIPEAAPTTETWCAIDLALKRGTRGLAGRSSLARLLAQRRGVRHLFEQPTLTEETVLAWADDHHTRTGEWPTANSGAVLAAPSETWFNLNANLTAGNRGLAGGSSLARLLAAHRGYRNSHGLSPFSVATVLAWADAFFAAHGRWPTSSDREEIPGSGGDTWSCVDAALCGGARGCEKGSSLAKLLERERGARNRKNLPPLTEEQILAWADEHHRRTGQWPSELAGVIPGSNGEVWANVVQSMRDGRRGMQPGDSVHRLLVRTGRKRCRGYSSPRKARSRIAGSRALSSVPTLARLGSASWHFDLVSAILSCQDRGGTQSV